MASINGLSIKNVKTWMGREGEACQGDVYLGNEKICFWSQDGNGGIDTYDFERMYSEKKFIAVIKELYKEKPLIYQEMKIDYDVDLLMGDILNLDDLEQSFLKSGHDKGMLVISNVFYRNIDFLSKNECALSDNEIKEKYRDNIDSFSNYYKLDTDVEIFRSIKDFDKGIPIQIEKIYDVRKINEFYKWETIVLENKMLTKEEFDKLNSEEQQKILALDFIPSKKEYCFYEKNYLLNLTRETNKETKDIELDER